MKEFSRWAPHFRVVNLINTELERVEILKNDLLPGKFDVCVTTYEAVRGVQQLRKFKWHYVIFDEAHKLKNAESQVTVQSRKIPSQRRLLLTGTPLMNNISELWTLLNLLMP